MDAEALSKGPVAQDNGAVSPAGETNPHDTRERILDVALDLFIEKGYDKTSLREIAEQLGVTKAALYYHFKSKQDILMALHYRMHGLLEDSILSIGGGVSADPQKWPAMFDTLLDKMLANRKLFLMHDRNRAAFEGMHREGHEESHLDIEAEFRRILNDPAISLRDKVRFTCAQSALLGGLLLTTGIDLPEGSLDELAELLREAVHGVLGQPTAN